MGASEIREFWKRAILTAKDFLDLWLKEIPGDDPFGVLAMLADLAGADYRCLYIPGHIPVLELFVESQQTKRQEAQDRAVATLRKIVSDRTGIERADSVQLRRDGLVEAFELRKVAAPRFLYPPSLPERIRDELASGAFDATAKSAKAAALGCEHNPDFRSVRWFGAKYTFSQTQARAIEVLWHAWEDGELGVSQKDIGEAVGSASNKFRLRDLFRLPKDPKGMHPAWKTMIHDDGRGLYALRRPPAGVPAVDAESSR